nr:hypothetical protein B0A51_12170 [Rachicladosporium sp. CCFEE 5018]
MRVSGTTAPGNDQSFSTLSKESGRQVSSNCDRTKPCSACCARGHPKECEFIVGEGNDYSPIQQSYEIRKLRSENQNLKERLRDAHLLYSGDEVDADEPPDGTGSKVISRATAAKQRRFRTSDRIDNIYFGTPGLASIVSDFANLQVGNHSLTHTMPKGQDMYPPQGSMYPFPMMRVGDNTTAALLMLLPPREEVFDCLDFFSKRAQSCSFPHMPDEVTKKEVGRFLDEAGEDPARMENNSNMLALIFATLATGMQMGVHDRSGEQWIEGAVEDAAQRGDCYLAACMQALRNATFMSRPTLLGVQTLIMLGPYLTNSGRFLDAWTLFGSTIRMAHSIGLHRNPKSLDPVPPLREGTIRQSLWWWMLHMDQQYSVTLGRPLGISGLGDCPPPEPLTTDTTVLRLGEFADHFTILARQILSSDSMMNVGKIDEFTDKLMGLWDTMPESLQFNESWSREDTVLPDWPLDVMAATLFAKVQSIIVLLNRQRVEGTQHSTSDSPPTMQSSFTTSFTSTTYTPSTTGGDSLLHPAPIRGRALVVNSSIHLLQTFLFFRHRNPAMLICWTLGQQAFNAAMILILDAWETSNENNEWLVNQAFVVFDEMQRNGVHKLAALAVQHISDGLMQLGHRRQERLAAVEEAHAMSRSNSEHLAHYPFHPTLTMPPTPLLDLSGDAVMGNSGTFLLEDTNLQSYTQQPYAPFNFALPPGAAGSYSHDTAQPNQQAHLLPPFGTASAPVSNVTIAPFPVMSPRFVPAFVPTAAPGLYSLGLQPRMQSQRRMSGFVPVNAAEGVFAGGVGQKGYAHGPRRASHQGYVGYPGAGQHRIERTTKSRRVQRG